ncbi:Gag-Pol polyprotein-like protein [Argiope bruennichi]|uniref:Gag-Pol polyprotein-like protein n=1 Tax=Argiope bruennichi TaxID=94029 RepID=A0A8T0FBS6_ARGBR|nr:Gag-Pol polyprotein-like protein [Argiope bruennichi]
MSTKKISDVMVVTGWTKTKVADPHSPAPSGAPVPVQWYTAAGGSSSLRPGTSHPPQQNCRKQDLIKLATELGEEVEGDLKVIELRELILKTSIYKEDLDFVKDTLKKNIITERLEREERERVADEKERIERDRAYELEKLRLQVESQKLEQTPGLELLPADQQATFNLKKLLPDFDPQDGDMTLFLNLFKTSNKNSKIERCLDRVLPWFPSQSRRNPGGPHQSRRDPSYKDRPPLSCYGCGEPGVVKAKCAKCNPMVQGDRTQPPTLNHMNFYSILMESQPSSIIEITICGSQAAVCADTGATHSVAGEKLYHFLKNKGLRFENSTVDMALADGHVQKTDILTTTVDIGVAGKVIPTKLIVLKNSKGNRTLLGTDFLRAAGIVLDLQKGLWYFSEAPHQSFNFIEPPADIKSLLAVPVASHPCQLREKEGTHLSGEQRTKFNSRSKRDENVSNQGGTTPFIEHRINTDILSRPICDEKENPYEVCNIAIADLPVRSAKDMREAQLADENLKKIIDSFESTQKTEDFANWTERGFLMNQCGPLQIFPDADSQEAQLVIPSSERDSIMEKHHDDRGPVIMEKKNATDIKANKPEAQWFTANPSPISRFEINSIDLFGPLPKTENVSAPLQLIEEIFPRYGIPRRKISDNGSQFVSAVLQQVWVSPSTLANLIPVYFPQSNPVERKNRDLKPRLAILVGDDHGNWHSKLPMIRFAMNTAVF